ncbi:NmrA family transcriptional regulator [Streptomyces sp. NPDC097619]|uniref:NmrA family transcriptional regulator n=1 Tax=Streptomyces sp. NPDC097619 TaxID=3157228 RepID=UPI0033222529
MTQNTGQYTGRHTGRNTGQYGERQSGPRGDGSAPVVLVTTATGKTGRRVAERLTELGYGVRAGSRTGEVRFDWEDPAGWGPALAGADLAYVAYYPELAVPEAVPALREFGRQAVAHGVRRLVVLSGRGEAGAVRAEAALREAGAEVTAVRAAFFAENFSEGLFREAVIGGGLAFPAGATAEPFVTAEDVAEVATAVLTGAAPAGAVYEVTGPRALTFGEALMEIGRAAGREVRYEAVSTAEYATLLEGYGLPGPEAGFLAELFAGILDGRNTPVSDGVERALGRAPREFAAYAREAADAGAWD